MMLVTLLFLLMGVPVIGVGVWMYQVHRGTKLGSFGIVIVLLGALPALLWVMILLMGMFFFN